MKKGKRKRQFLSAMILTAVSLLCAAVYQIKGQIVFDESNAVRYRDFAAANAIEESTLFLGTHLIHIQGLTDELYEKALDSASDSGQQAVYYKSELSDGTWYEITDAVGLADISTAGTPVSENELSELWVTHVTGSDGITREAATGSIVCIFDEPDPYDLYQLSELEPLRLQYDNLSELEEKPDDITECLEKTGDFLRLDLRNEKTAEYDRQKELLQEIYQTLKQQKEDEKADIVYKLMDKVDSARRAEIFYRLVAAEDCELNLLQQECQLTATSEVMTAIGESIQNCQESYISYSGNQLEEGSTILKNEEYRLSMEVLKECENGLTERFNEALTVLKHIYNLQEDTVKDAQGELNVLEETLLPAADEKYRAAVSALPSEAYQAAVMNRASLTAREQLLGEQKDECDSVRSQLQYLIQAKTKRTAAQEGLGFTYQRIDWADGLSGSIPQSDFRDSALESIWEHILWLRDLAENIVNSHDSLNSPLDALKEQKSELQERLAEALDENDLALAKQYEALLDNLTREIEEEEERLADILNSPDATPSQKTQAGLSLGSGSLAGSIENMKKRALEAVLNGDGNSIEHTVDALAALGAKNALNEILLQLEAQEGYQSMKHKVEKAIADSRESSLYNGSGSSGENGSGSGAGTNQFSGVSLSENELSALIENELGAPFEELDSKDQASAVAAVNQLAEAGNRNASALAALLANRLADDGNACLYLQYTKVRTPVYVSLKAVAYCSGYRYVYSDSKQQAVLTKKASIYQFSVGSKKVVFADKTEDLMGSETRFQMVSYIDTDAAEQYFQCYAVYISGTNYGLCMDAQMKKMSDELYQTFTGGED